PPHGQPIAWSAVPTQARTCADRGRGSRATIVSGSSATGTGVIDAATRIPPSLVGTSRSTWRRVRPPDASTHADAIDGASATSGPDGAGVGVGVGSTAGSAVSG